MQFRPTHSIEDGEDFTSCGGTIPAASSHRTTGETKLRIPSVSAASYTLGEATSSETFAALGEVAFQVLLRCSSVRLKVVSGELRGDSSPLMPAWSREEE